MTPCASPPCPETVLHSFGLTVNDGQAPDAALLEVKGLLYGTTEYGGSLAHGTVFTLSP